MSEALLSEVLETLYQYVSDLRYPPEGDSVDRRIKRANEVIAKVRSARSAMGEG